MSNYSRKYYFKFLFVLGVSLKKLQYVLVYTIVYEIPTLVKYLWNALRTFLRIRGNYFSSHRTMIAFDLPVPLTK